MASFHKKEKMTYYKPKIDGWFWILIFVLTFTLLMVCSISEDGLFWPGIIVICVFFFIVLFLIWIITTVKYAIRGKELGIRNLVYKWEWLPIEKIESVKPVKSVLAGAALSFNRLSIKFSDRKVLRSTMPLEIVPKDEKVFIEKLKEINPEIKVLN